MIKTRENKIFQVVAHSVMIIVSVCAVLPFILLFMSSITSEKALIANGYSFFPKSFSLDSYKYIANQGQQIFRAYGITILVTAVGTFINIMISALLAYPLSVRDLPGRRAITFYVFFTMLFNGGLVPSYLMYTNFFHIKDTIFAFIVPNFLMSAINVLLIRTFITSSIPSALFEAAQIDGAGHMKTFINIVIPLGKPILVTMGMFSGLAYWNDWTNGLYYITDQKLFSIQVLLNQMITNIQFLSSNSMSSTVGAEANKVPATGVRMAIAFVAMIPILVIFPFLQKYFEKGIALGAVKG